MLTLVGSFMAQVNAIVLDRTVDAINALIGTNFTWAQAARILTVISIVLLGKELLSALITWSLEASVTTADSMRARGYGLHPRTSYSNYHFDGCDAVLTLFILVGIACSGLAAGYRVVSVRFFPSFRMNGITPLFILYSAVYALTLFIPAALDLYEAHKWHSSISKI